MVSSPVVCFDLASGQRNYFVREGGSTLQTSFWRRD